MRREKLAAFIVIGCLFAQSSDECSAARIGVDNRFSFHEDYSLASGAHRELFRATIAAAGHTIVPLNSFLGELDDFAAVILHQHPNYTLSAAEISSIHNFVDNGGGLLMAAEGGSGSDDTIVRFNSLAGPYGVTFNTVGIGEEGNGYTVRNFVAHPVTAGVSVAGVDFHRRMTSIMPPAVDLTSGDGLENIVAAVTGQAGSGNVVLLSDISLWIDPEPLAPSYDSFGDRPITFGDNGRLLRNIIAFITIPEPDGRFQMLVAVAAALMALRIRCYCGREMAEPTAVK